MNLEKLKNIPELTAVKKIYLLLNGAQKNRATIEPCDRGKIILYLKNCSIVDKKRLENIIERIDKGEREQLLTDYLGSIAGHIEPDWDWLDDKGMLDKSKRLIEEKYLVLDEVRSAYNVGAIFRSAESFGIKKIFLLGVCATPEHPKAVRTSAGCIDSVEYQFMSHNDFIDMVHCDNILKSLPLFALECGGDDINKHKFTDKGIAIIGNEEFGICEKLLNISQYKLTIETFGAKGSLNLSVACGILLNLWSRI